MNEILKEVSENDKRTKLRQSYFAKWDGTDFLYGEEARQLRLTEATEQKGKDAPSES